MNLTYLRYAVEIADTGSINKAAENIFVAPSNLSRAIKDLENELGIKIFERTSKGMIPTQEGAELLNIAKSISAQVNDLEQMCRDRTYNIMTFSVCVPRVSLAGEAFVDLIRSLENFPTRMYYHETDSRSALKRLLDYSCNLAVVRSGKKSEKALIDYISANEMECRKLSEYNLVVMASKESPLADVDDISFRSLMPLTEISFTNTYAPYEATNDFFGMGIPYRTLHHVFVTESMSALSILSSNPNAFLWCPPVDENSLARAGLIERKCSEYSEVITEYIVWRKNYRFNNLDRTFIESAISAGQPQEKRT